MKANELINQIIDIDCSSPSCKETILITNDIIETLIKIPKDEIINDLKYALEEYANSYNLCYKCGQPLQVIHKNYEKSEFQGMEVQEEINIWGCSNCD